MIRNRLPSGLVSLLALLPVISAQAQTSVDLMIRPFPAEQPAEFKADAYFLGSGETDRDEEFGGNPAGSDRDYSLSLYDFKGRMRVAPQERIDPRIGLAATYVSPSAHDPALPDQFLDASVAVGFGVFAAGGWVGALTLGYGYAGAGDELFTDGNAWYPKASLVFGKKLSRTDTLAVVIDYDANRTYKPDVPLPGLIWQKLIFGRSDDGTAAGAGAAGAGPPADVLPGAGPSRAEAAAFEPRLLLTLGFPYANVHYRPVERLTLEATFLMPDDFSARVDYDLLGNRILGIYASYDTRRNAFHWDALADGDDRIMLRQRRAEVGVRWTPVKHGERGGYALNLLAAVGYAFAQELTVGFDSTDDDKLAELSDEPYFRIGVELGF
jgi:hypothetical protein